MKNLFLCTLLFLSVKLSAQKLPDNGFNRVRITKSEENIQLEIKPVIHLPNPEIDKTYYWYAANEVHQTRGGYSGQLLNGNYSGFFLNKNLKEQVLFNDGLPDGEWKQWYETGNLRTIITWKNGVKDGTYILYNEEGRKVEEGKYAKGLRHGKITVYVSADSLQIQRYRNGVPVPEKKPLWKRLHFFRKKDKTVQQK